MVHKTHFKAQIAKYIDKIYAYQHKYESLSEMCGVLRLNNKDKTLQSMRKGERDLRLSSYLKYLHLVRTGKKLSDEEKYALASEHLKKLGELRKKKNLTHREISEATYMIGRGVINEKHVVDYLNGKTGSSLGTYLRLRIAIYDLPARSKKGWGWSRPKG